MLHSFWLNPWKQNIVFITTILTKTWPYERKNITPYLIVSFLFLQCDQSLGMGTLTRCYVSVSSFSWFISFYSSVTGNLLFINALWWLARLPPSDWNCIERSRTWGSWLAAEMVPLAGSSRWWTLSTWTRFLPSLCYHWALGTIWRAFWIGVPWVSLSVSLSVSRLIVVRTTCNLMTLFVIRRS